MKAFSGGGIKSVQRGVSTVPDATSTITINTVDPTKCLVIVDKFGNGGSAVYDEFRYNAVGVISNSTTLSLIVKSTNSLIDYAWTVVEFSNGSIQHGTIAPTSTGTFNATINAVDIDKAILVFVRAQSNFTTGLGDELRERAKVELTSPTNIAATFVVYNSVFRIEYMIWSP